MEPITQNILNLLSKTFSNDDNMKIKEFGLEIDSELVFNWDIEEIAEQLYEKIIEEEEWQIGLINDY